ncbi:hypothetical protein [Cryobacterium sp. Y11]|uniref:hypothetical protein n=1 Tax=Cryobacterium sp. Y11 TaxID=2045016 RepID=UPI000CE459E1|nr:hypothetical protein [Cryobacterium sp. Y11]
MNESITTLDEHESTGRDMLSAAHVLLSSERIANEQELLVSTCVEVLSSGPAPLSAIHSGVNLIWPGAHLSIEKIENALSYAQRGGVITTQQASTGTGWALTQAGMVEIQATQSWYSDALGRLAAQIQERATQDFGGVTGEQADLWAAILLRIFSDAIITSPDAYGGAINRAASGNVRPVSLDGSQMREAINRLDSPEGTREFLGACLLAAVDESDPFGNEIVNYVATSCVLHSIVAGRSRASAQNDLGSLVGQRIVLDTPVLVAYLGPDDTAAHLTSVVRLSLELGMEVIVPQHVLNELNEVIDRVEGQHIPGLLQSLQGGVSARVYASSVNEQVLELFLEAAEAGQYRTWDDFARRARGIESELSSLGITVRGHENIARQNVDKLIVELTEVITNTSSNRGARQIARDAESMELVWRARRRSSRDQTNLWPGGWIITHDRKLSPAYRKANSRDLEPLVLSPGQWATLVTESAPAPEVRELIEAAASFLRQEAVLRIAVKYPPDIALDLAQTLSQGSVTETDIRVAQLTLVDLLDGASSGVPQNGESISTFVANKRSNRQAIAANVQRNAFVTERKRMADTVTRSVAELSVASSARATAELSALTSQTEIDRLRSERDDLEREKSEYVALNGRRTLRVTISVLGVIAAAFLFVLGLPGFAIGTIVGLFIFFNQSREWATDKGVASGRLASALPPEILGLWDIIQGLQ